MLQAPAVRLPTTTGLHGGAKAEAGTYLKAEVVVRKGLYVGDLFAVFDHLNLSPINTILLVVLGLFIRQSVKSIFCRVGATEEGITRLNRKNRKQDVAIRRIEQHLHLQPITYDDDD